MRQRQRLDGLEIVYEDQVVHGAGKERMRNRERRNGSDLLARRTALAAFYGSGARQEVIWQQCRCGETCRARLRLRRMKGEEPEAAFPSHPLLLHAVNDARW